MIESISKEEKWRQGKTRKTVGKVMTLHADNSGTTHKPSNTTRIDRPSVTHQLRKINKMLRLDFDTFIIINIKCIQLLGIKI